VLGASGCGKSTLLHMLGGLDRPDEGAVHFDGQDIFRLRGGRLDRYRSRHVGFVFQFYHLLPELTALENVLIGAMISRSLLQWPGQRKALRDRAVELLDTLGLGQRLRHRPSKLSGGERQRVAVARALINQPDVLLADEPTGNLDVDTGRQLLDVFRSLHARGQTIVMVTHDAQIAAAADRRWRLTRGQLQSEA
jgi:ABC-type lipoprotein export system ATPase subunit